nr:MAG TPA: hypothetical protein [Caudoviricetes sp.]
MSTLRLDELNSGQVIKRLAGFKGESLTECIYMGYVYSKIR